MYKSLSLLMLKEFDQLLLISPKLLIQVDLFTKSPLTLLHMKQYIDDLLFPDYKSKNDQKA